MANDAQRAVILIGEDAEQTRSVSGLIAREDWRLLTADTPDAALAMLDAPMDAPLLAVLVDQAVAGERTCDLVRTIREKQPLLPILVLTASASPLLAVEAMRAGATDYLIKPIVPERLLRALVSATRERPPRDELQPLSEKLDAEIDFEAMVGTAPPFRTALAKAATAARGHGHVLVEGESGTGKEMLMRAMHAASARAKAMLRRVNCGGMPTNTLESLLFGHERGAFAGAFERQIGLLQHCDGGTLVLDEIDRLDPDLQERLAAVLATGIVRPTGAQHGFKVDVRIFAASDSDIDALVATGGFAPALMEQLSATRVHMPALRDRMGDMPALTRYFLSKIAEQPGLAHHSIADSALSLLEAYDWPGNVRQLQAVLFRAALFCDGEALTADSFPQLVELLGDCPDRGESRARGLGVLLYTDDGNLRALEEIEADVIRIAIGHYRGRMTEVARRLGIGRSTLYRKLADLGIDNAA